MIKVLFILNISFVILSCNGQQKAEIDQTNEDVVELNSDTIEIIEAIELVSYPSQIVVLDTNNYWLESGIELGELYFYAAGSHEEIIDNEGIWHNNIVHKYDEKLTEIELGKFIKMLVNETSFGNEATECFDPHHAIILKDSIGEVKGHFSICFNCSNYRSYPRTHHLSISYFESLFKKYNFPIERGDVTVAVKDFFNSGESKKNSL